MIIPDAVYLLSQNLKETVLQCTDKVEVLEERPKKPMASEVKSAIDVLTSYSLFVNEGLEEIRRHVQKIEALAERNFRNSQRHQTLLSFFGSKMQSPLNNKDQ